MTPLVVEQKCAEQPKGVDLALSQLKVARVFADFSSTSYLTGKLQRAIDARFKAELLCRAAAVQMAADTAPADVAESLLRGVLNTLAKLPEFSLRARAAG
ncbi:MAG TPA: hypothetical protein VMT32_08150 [Bryobacteraceae bacterium]|nr:hypothetical protein [Bryobacteraceae bacterium]